MLSLQVDRMSSRLYIGKLTTFQQLDFTNGETASVFLQLHIWLSLLLCGAKAGSPHEHSPLEPCSPPGPATAAWLRGTPAPQAPGALSSSRTKQTQNTPPNISLGEKMLQRVFRAPVPVYKVWWFQCTYSKA